MSTAKSTGPFRRQTGLTGSTPAARNDEVGVLRFATDAEALDGTKENLGVDPKQLNTAAPQLTVTATDGADGTAAITIQASIAEKVLVDVWFDDAATGAPADLGTLTISTGQLVQQIVDDAHERILSDASGTIVLSYNRTANGDIYVFATAAAVAQANVAVTGNA